MARIASEHQATEIPTDFGLQNAHQHTGPMCQFARYVVVCLQFNIIEGAEEFQKYFEHVKSLSFEDRPDFDYLKKLFRELYIKSGFPNDNVFDWEIPLSASSAAKSGSAPNSIDGEDGENGKAHVNQPSELSGMGGDDVMDDFSDGEGNDTKPASSSAQKSSTSKPAAPPARR